jgi:hypothetical protein
MVLHYTVSNPNPLSQALAVPAGKPPRCLQLIALN